MLVDIIEKVGQGLYVNELWEYLVQLMESQNDKEYVFKIYGTVYPPNPDKQSPASQYFRYNDIQICISFNEELKHGKKLLLQKRPKGQTTNSPFVKTYLDLLDTEYHRQKRKRYEDVCSLSFGEFFYFTERAVGSIMKLFGNRSPLVYKWLKRDARSLKQLDEYLQKNIQRYDATKFQLPQLLLKRICRFCSLFELVMKQWGSVLECDTDGKLLSMYYRFQLKKTKQNRLLTLIPSINGSVKYFKGGRLPLPLQLVKFIAVQKSHTYNPDIKDLNNLFNQFYDSFDAQWLGDLKCICRWYIQHYIQTNEMDTVCAIYEALLSLPVVCQGEKGHD